VKTNRRKTVADINPSMRNADMRRPRPAKVSWPSSAGTACEDFYLHTQVALRIISKNSR